MPKVSINQPAPNFELNDFNGKPFKITDFTGKKHILLVFNRGFA